MEIAKNKVLMGIYAGAGGVDAQDWASMLLRMYQRYAQKKNWAFVVLYESLGEQGGIKTASIEIAGPDVYEKLKQENGVHRLVKISPFSAKQLRHTSFALVEIMPEIQLQDIKFESKDLRIDTFRSSGPGGQNVNKLETAVRITHIPTGMAVAVQSERSQAQNREKVLAIICSYERLSIYKILRKWGYHSDVWEDEIVAYFITGLTEELSPLRKQYRDMSLELTKAFMTHYGFSISRASAQEMLNRVNIIRW